MTNVIYDSTSLKCQHLTEYIIQDKRYIVVGIYILSKYVEGRMYYIALRLNHFNRTIFKV